MLIMHNVLIFIHTIVSVDGGKDHGRNVLKAAAKESQFVQCFASEAPEMTNKLL